MTLFGLLMRHLLSLFRSYRTGVTAPKEHTTFSTDSEDPGFYGCDVDGASDVQPVRELVGHDDLVTTTRTYTHVVADEREIEYAEVLG